jgi:hypothetical protein
MICRATTMCRSSSSTASSWLRASTLARSAGDKLLMTCSFLFKTRRIAVARFRELVPRTLWSAARFQSSSPPTYGLSRLRARLIISADTRLYWRPPRSQRQAACAAAQRCPCSLYPVRFCSTKAKWSIEVQIKLLATFSANQNTPICCRCRKQPIIGPALELMLDAWSALAPLLSIRPTMSARIWFVRNRCMAFVPAGNATESSLADHCLSVSLPVV